MRISLAQIVNFVLIKNKQSKKIFKLGQKFCIFKTIYDPVIFANNSFLKGMALWEILGQNVKKISA
jgi:hypothetical protein